MPLSGPEFDIETPRLKEVIDRLKAINPKLATNLRRELRASGEEIIAAQRAELAKRPPRVGSSQKKLRLITPRNGDKPYFAFRRTYQPGDTREGGVSNLRDQIAAGLRTRVVTAASRDGVEVKTNGPRVGGSNMARVWQSKEFRHPVFGNDSEWAVQFGSPYFFGPVTDELRNNMRDRITRAVDDALAAAGG
ncbi:hypothetical protein JNB62_13170 [Microbacterium jejuense]|uniref:Phage protein, HK97 gp10 family n=1 Tax=Microbacterium jejuense TaxID=1263637 RepID=A0ABS7HNV7_9MICO|nr:hypothetical protein [Microbacterium jejuense]MBW9094641.1 hypothetical protein [Microbacterium jejuense]